MNECKPKQMLKVDKLDITLNDLNLPQYDNKNHQLKIDLIDDTGLFKLSNPRLSQIKGEFAQVSVLEGDYNGTKLEITTTYDTHAQITRT